MKDKHKKVSTIEYLSIQDVVYFNVLKKSHINDNIEQCL